MGTTPLPPSEVKDPGVDEDGEDDEDAEPWRNNHSRRRWCEMQRGWVLTKMAAGMLYCFVGVT